MALIYRAYFGLIRNPRITSKGFNTSAIFGYINTLINLLETHQPSHIAVAFDTSEPTQRHLEFPQYKAQRDAMPEDISASIPHIYKITEAFNIPTLTCPGYEADDIIGTLARKAESENFETYMVTPDKDFAQLVDDHTYMFKPARSGGEFELLGVNEILKNWDIERVEQVIDILGLWGDTSDNIPGIPGIGEKTAKQLIKQFDSMEKIIENADLLKGKQKEKVKEFAEQGLLSKKLVTIDCNTPVNTDLDALKIQPPNLELLKLLFVEFEFKTLGKRFFTNISQGAWTAPINQLNTDGLELFSAQPESKIKQDSENQFTEELFKKLKTINDVEHDYLLINSDDGYDMLYSALSQQTSICFDIETTGLDTKIAELVGIAFTVKKHAGYYLFLPANRKETEALLERFRPIFENEAIEKIGHNLKFDISVLKWYGISVCGKLFDTMLAHYLIESESRHNMDFLAEVYLEYQPVSISSLIGEKGILQKNMRDIDADKATQYAVEDTDVTLQLKEIFKTLLIEKECISVFTDIEMPLIDVLIRMEMEGIKIDVDTLKDYSITLDAQISKLSASIKQQAGIDFNIDSPKQLGEVLFDHLQLDAKAAKTKKTGQYSTSESVLSKLASKHPLIGDVLEYRSYRKLKNTYVDTLPNEIFPGTNRIHTTFSQAVTATGRLNSQHPNLQNIPIKTEKGREIRKAFIPRNDDYLILSADYSQIELRIMAELSGDEEMINAFQNNIDIHNATAAKIFNVTVDHVTDDMRRKSKMANFGIIYGISAFGLSQRLNIPRTEAKFIIDQYFEEYPQVKEYMDKTIDFAHKNEYVKTKMGRKRYLRDINSKNGTIRAAVERNAINAPIQGTAADMIKIAMINIQKNLDIHSYQSKLLIQIHDELVFDLYRGEREQVIPMIKHEMESAITMDVPIIVEIGLGKNWLEAH